MSYYRYIGDWFVHYIQGTEDTVDDHTNALQSLLKSELRECENCNGCGEVDTTFNLWNPRPLSFILEKLYKKNPDICWSCYGAGVVCAWCQHPEDICNCGGEE